MQRFSKFCLVCDWQKQYIGIYFPGGDDTKFVEHIGHLTKLVNVLRTRDISKSKFIPSYIHVYLKVNFLVSVSDTSSLK